MLICPKCGAPVAQAGSGEIVCVCGEIYRRLPSGGLDFLQAKEFPDFELDAGNAQQRELLEQECNGVAARINDFIIPIIRRFAACAGKSLNSLAILDCGCGSGMSVDILRRQGADVWGMDAGRSRHLQWQKRTARDFLISANALRIPFADASFDAVLSFGLIEHLGIHEEETANGYRAHRLADCTSQRRRFVKELVRIMKEDGLILLDHPNGAFPADFWHGGKAGSIRWHKPYGDMLPRFPEIAACFRSADPRLKLISLSPSRRLGFNKVAAHWYGRAFSPVMKIWLRLMEHQSLSFLARSFLNPYIVTVATRRADSRSWI
jgi:SAM-dependent methyltransferase